LPSAKTPWRIWQRDDFDLLMPPLLETKAQCQRIVAALLRSGLLYEQGVPEKGRRAPGQRDQETLMTSLPVWKSSNEHKRSNGLGLTGIPRQSLQTRDGIILAVIRATEASERELLRSWQPDGSHPQGEQP
jgi:hypothetical protein